MFRKLIHPILVFPICLFVHSQEALLSKTKDNIEEIQQKKENPIFIDYSVIKNIISQNNKELKSLKELVISSEFNQKSKISKRYPTLNFSATGLPQYQAGSSFNSNSGNTETSQYTANPSLTLKLDLINPTTGNEIKISKDNFLIAKNNYEIKKKDLIKEAKSRYHKLQKSYQDINNKTLSLDLSLTSLKDAQSKFDAGIGTKFEVLEADAQLSRDRQSLNEKKIEFKINEISLKEILNIEENILIHKDQNLKGFWNYDLQKNIKNGLERNLSIKNINLQKSIKQNQANNFLNANKPYVYISNTFSASFSKGDALTTKIDIEEYGSSYSNTIGLNFNWNIFDGGQNKNSYKSSNADAKSEEYSYKNFENILKTNISQAYFNLKLNEEKILSSLKEISSTEESLRLARLRYEVGISTLKDVLVRQKELSNANSKKINAIYNYNLNLDELERLTFLEISNACNEENYVIKNDNQSICNI